MIQGILQRYHLLDISHAPQFVAHLVHDLHHKGERLLIVVGVGFVVADHHVVDRGNHTAIAVLRDIILTLDRLVADAGGQPILLAEGPFDLELRAVGDQPAAHCRRHPGGETPLLEKDLADFLVRGDEFRVLRVLLFQLLHGIGLDVNYVTPACQFFREGIGQNLEWLHRTHKHLADPALRIGVPSDLVETAVVEHGVEAGIIRDFVHLKLVPEGVADQATQVFSPLLPLGFLIKSDVGDPRLILSHVRQLDLRGDPAVVHADVAAVGRPAFGQRGIGPILVVYPPLVTAVLHGPIGFLEQLLELLQQNGIFLTAEQKGILALLLEQMLDLHGGLLHPTRRHHGFKALLPQQTIFLSPTFNPHGFSVRGDMRVHIRNELLHVIHAAMRLKEKRRPSATLWARRMPPPLNGEKIVEILPAFLATVVVVHQFLPPRGFGIAIGSS